jgi:transcriptional regulator with XRE-family HTH domain
MNKLSLLSTADVQSSLCDWLRLLRKEQKLSRQQLALRSTVPASTIKKFENTGQISLRQFILLWQSLDELARLNDLTKADERQSPHLPLTIDQVLKG